MGTNFYFQYDFGFGQVYEKHIAKISGGWLPLFEQIGDVKSVKDLKRAYLAAPFKIVDEYGEEYTWDEFEKRVVDWNKDNPKALSHIKPPENFSKDNMLKYYGNYWSADRFIVDEDGYEFSKDEFS